MNQRPLPCVLAGFVLGEVWIFQFHGTAALAAFLCAAVLFFGMALRRKGSLFFFHKKLEITKRALLAFCIGLLLGGIRYGSWQADKDSFQQWFDKEKCLIHGQIQDVKLQNERTTVSLKKLVIESKVQKGRLILYFDREMDLPVGGTLELKGKIEEFSLPSNPGEFNQKAYQAGKGNFGFVSSPELLRIRYGSFLIKDGILRIRSMLKEHLEKNMDQQKSAVAQAMLLGDKTGLLEEQKSLYETGGISHVLAVSGLHMTLIGAGLYKMLRKAGMSYGISVCSSFPVLFFYAVLTGMSSSCLRASLMLAVYLLAEWKGYCYDLPSSLSLAGFLLLMEIPDRLFDSGFLLSFGAMAAVGLVLPFLLMLFEYRTGKNKIWDSVLSSGGILILTLPLSLYFFYGVSAAGLFLNVIVIPLMSLLVPLLVVGSAGAVPFVPDFLWKGSLFLAEWILELYETLCIWSEWLPGGYLQIGYRGIGFAAGYYLILTAGICLIYFLGRKIRLITFGAVSAFLIFFIAGTGRMDSFCTFLDVGQGDGILFRSPTGYICMVDGGSTSKNKIGNYLLEPVLEYYGISAVDTWFLSHLDEDHISGVLELIEKDYPIGRLVLPVTEQGKDSELAAIAKEKGIEIRYMKKGDRWSLPGVSFTCLHPSLSEKTEDKNENSLVFLLETNNQQILLTGDVENESEKRMAETFSKQFLGEEKVRILKVSHHGSANGTTEELLDAFDPDYAIVSCGKNNRYGHPAEETVKRLTQHRTILYQTTECGAIEVILNENTKFLQYGGN